MKCDLQFCTEYINTWTEAMLDENNALLSAWYGLHDWTKAHMVQVLYPLASKLNYDNKCGTRIQQEYYRVDFTLYSYYSQSVWTLDYAVEHENAEFQLRGDKVANKGWFDEFAKLLPLKCAKARVIIGYDTFDSNVLFEQKLKCCQNLLMDKNVQSSLADSSIFLIIFPRTKYIKNGDYSNGLLHIVHFYKDGDKWTMEKDLAEIICDNETKKRIKSVYKKITEKY